MNDFNIYIKCKHCDSDNILIKAIDAYEGDVVLMIECEECGITETYNVLNEIKNNNMI